MNDPQRRAQSLVAACCLGFLLLNYPLLALADHTRTVLGMPLLYGYLFGVWGLLIAFVAWLSSHDGRS